MAGEYMLSTLDNPYNPHTHWDQWLQHDQSLGYYSSQYLSRIARTSDELSELDNEIAIDDAMNEIVAEDLIGVYIKVKKTFVPMIDAP